MNTTSVALEQFNKEIAYFRAHRDQLLKQHPEQWVAILDQIVVASDSEPERLIAVLRQRGIPTERVLIEHLTQSEDTLIL